MPRRRSLGLWWHRIRRLTNSRLWCLPVFQRIRIEPAEQSETASSVLIIRSLNDLKNRLAKVILMVLIVRYFERVVSVNFKTPLGLLLLANAAQ